MVAKTLKSSKAMTLLQDSQKELRIADHMIYYTTQLIDNANLFMSCVRHLRNSLMYSARSLLENEFYYKQVSYIPSDHKMMLKLFLDKFGTKLGLSMSDMKFLKEINYVYDLIEHGKTSLKKGNTYIVVSTDF